jgi:hypothetical protein
MPWHKRDEIIVCAYVIGIVLSFSALLWAVFNGE